MPPQLTEPPATQPELPTTQPQLKAKGGSPTAAELNARANLIKLKLAEHRGPLGWAARHRELPAAQPEPAAAKPEPPAAQPKPTQLDRARAREAFEKRREAEQGWLGNWLL